MRWSKVKELVEDTFATDIRGRIKIYSTQYTYSSSLLVSRGWITIDGEEIADMNSLMAWVKGYSRPLYEETWGNNKRRHSEKLLLKPDEYERAHLHQSCWDYLHQSLNDSLNSENPLLNALALLNEKVGINRLKRFRDKNKYEHPLPNGLLHFRLSCNKQSLDNIR